MMLNAELECYDTSCGFCHNSESDGPKGRDVHPVDAVCLRRFYRYTPAVCDTHDTEC